MMEHARMQQKMPEPEAFIIWAKRSIADLNMHPSNFLLDQGVPGSINRVNKIIKKPSTLRLKMAVRLEKEIRTEADKKGVVLLPLGSGETEGGK